MVTVRDRGGIVEARADLFHVVDAGAVEQAVAAALAEADDPALVAARRAAAAERDWRRIADTLHGEIGVALSALPGRRRQRSAR